jgi:hypothetical protein
LLYVQVLKRNSDQTVFEKYFGNLGSSFKTAMKDPAVVKFLWTNGGGRLIVGVTGFLMVEHACTHANVKHIVTHVVDAQLNPDQPRVPFKVPETPSKSLLDKMLFERGVDSQKELIQKTIEEMQKKKP